MLLSDPSPFGLEVILPDYLDPEVILPCHPLYRAEEIPLGTLEVFYQTGKASSLGAAGIKGAWRLIETGAHVPERLDQVSESLWLVRSNPIIPGSRFPGDAAMLLASLPLIKERQEPTLGTLSSVYAGYTQLLVSGTLLTNQVHETMANALFIRAATMEDFDPTLVPNIASMREERSGLKNARGKVFNHDIKLHDGTPVQVHGVGRHGGRGKQRYDERIFNVSPVHLLAELVTSTQEFAHYYDMGGGQPQGRARTQLLTRLITHERPQDTRLLNALCQVIKTNVIAHRQQHPRIPN